MSGNLSFNNLSTASPQGGEAITVGSYTVDSTGRVTVTGLADRPPADFVYNLQLYMSGTGRGLAISMDTHDIASGAAAEQASETTFTAESFSGSYSLDLAQIIQFDAHLFAQSGVGTVVADGLGTLTGSLDVNERNLAHASDLPLSGGFAITPTNGVFTGTIADPVSGNSDIFTYYVVDAANVVAIENDLVQLSLGDFNLQ